MLASGVQMKEIQEWLSHSNFSTTADVYSHLDFSAKVKAANTIASAYEDSVEPVNVRVDYQEPDQPDILTVFAKAFQEMTELGFEKIEDYLAYKERQATNGKKKTPMQM